MVEDKYRNLWVGTAHGLNRFNLETEKVSEICLDGSEPPSHVRRNIKSLLYDSAKNVLWVGLQGGLYEIQLAPHDGTPSRPVLMRTEKNPYRQAVFSLLLDSEHNLLFGTKEGLGRIDHLTGEIEFPYALADKRIHDIEEDEQGGIWCSSYTELIRLQQNSLGGLTEKSIDLSKIGDFEGLYITSILKGRKGHIWAAAPHGTLEFQAESGELLRTIKGNSASNYNKNLQQYNSFIQDSSGLFWLGTDHGIDLLNSEEQRFKLYRAPLKDNYRTTTTRIRAVLEDSKGTLWFGTEGAGLYYLEAGASIPTEFRHEILFRKDVRAISEDQDGNLWLLLAGSELVCIAANGQKLKKVPIPEEIMVEIRSSIIGNIIPDNDQYLWFGAANYLVRYDRHLGNFILVKSPRGISVGIQTISRDDEGIFWIGTVAAGLFRFDPDSMETDNPMIEPVEITGVNAKYGAFTKINKIEVGEPGVLWLGTKDGLVKMDMRSGENFFFNTANTQIPDNMIYGVLRDGEGSMWLSTNKGICKFNPLDNSVWAFSRQDGLQDEEFNPGVCYQTKDGKMYFGGRLGLNSFYPKNIIPGNNYDPPVIFTNFEINNEFGDSVVLKKHIRFLDTIILNRRQNDLSFQVAALDFFSPEKNRFAYRLSTGDKEERWEQIRDGRTITFADLPPRTYKFEIRGSNHDGHWSKKQATLHLVIEPPWWQTWIAWISFFLIGTFFIALVTTWVNKRRRAEKEAKEREEIMTKFYTNVTHELRTPLTIIQGNAEEIENHQGNKNLILRNTRIIQNQINKILDLSRLESGAMNLQLIQGKITEFVKTITTAFQVLAEMKQIDLGFHSELEDDLYMDFDQEKLQQVVTNLLSNALKFTNDNGKINVTLRASELRGAPWLVIEVRDDGIGIEPKNLSKIFDRYFQENRSEWRIQRGTGIGLALSKSLVDLMGGIIKAESRVEQGSVFRVFLPITRKAKKKVHNFEVVTLDDEVLPRSPEDDTIALSSPIPIVLVIDDNPEILLHFHALLKPKFQLLFAQEGEGGIEKAVNFIPDIIICDVMIAGKNGFEVCTILKSKEVTSHIPIILLTAMADDAARWKGLKAGADAYLPKPYNKRELFIRLDKLIETRKRLQDKFAEQVIIDFSNTRRIEIEDPFMADILSIVSKNYQREEFDVTELIASVPYSRSQVFRKVKRKTGKSPNEFINWYRLNRAKTYIEDTDFAIAQIAYKVGFGDANHFTRKYKAEFGETPTKTRKKKRS